MTKFETAISILAGIALIGTIYLANAEKDTGVIIPTLLGLIGFLIGKKNEVISGFFKK